MTSIDEQTVLITGSTDGIGKATARKLARQGARVLIHGRAPAKVRRVADEIRSDTGNDKIEEYVADFAALENVRRLAEEVSSEHNILEVLINNAGIGFSETRKESEDGYELRFAVNYLSHFLLTHQLLPLLKKANGARIVNVSSAGQETIDFDDVMLENQYGAWRAYNQSKLALAMFTIELAEQLDDENITANCLHPGTFLNTKMVTGAGINPMGEPESGADAVTYLAIDPELEGVSGHYFDRKSRARANPQAYDKEARRKLWSISKKYVGLGD